MVKHTIDEIKIVFAREGYQLLEDTYLNNKTHLRYKCPNGHFHSTRFDNWVQGHRCPHCAGQGKPTINNITRVFNNEGYILLSDYYINSTTPLKFRCSNNHESEITWDSWREGCRCRHCAGNVRLSIEYIQQVFEKENCTLLTKKYVNNKTTLEYICSKGHISSTTWSDWQSGYRCKYCYYESMVGKGNPVWAGGYSINDYCDAWKDKNYKASIKERDSYICQNPICAKISNNLVVHHIDYDKKNCHPSNLITVCVSCNGKANKNRDWHTVFYKELLHKKYNYNY